jgi:hypothetical protein
MDPYLPIRNSALQFDLGLGYVSQSGIYAPKDTAKSNDPMNSGSDVVKTNSEGTLTEFKLKIRHGFVDGAEAVLEVPYYMGTKASRRLEPTTQNNSTVGAQDTAAAGMGDWILGAKYSYEPWGLGSYLAFQLPVGALFGTDAYTNGDGQINLGLFWARTFNDVFTVHTNFVYGYDLDAVNRKFEKQDSYTYYLRLGSSLPKGEGKYRPYVAYTMEGFGDYIENDTTEASSAMRHVVTPGIDMNVFNDFSAELSFPIAVAGSGNAQIATPAGWGVNFTLKYFWYRF